nr:MAG TPA: hypothetical protein [Caudoviricetes sp.]
MEGIAYVTLNACNLPCMGFYMCSVYMYPILILN